MDISTARLIFDLANGADQSPAIGGLGNVTDVRVLYAAAWGVATTAGVPDLDYVDVDLDTLGGSSYIQDGRVSHVCIPLTGAVSMLSPGAPIVTLHRERPVSVSGCTIKFREPTGVPLTSANVRRILLVVELTKKRV